jgi:hypothetical protein
VKVSASHNKQGLDKPGEVASGRPGGAAARRSAAAKSGAAARPATAAAMAEGRACFRLAQQYAEAALTRVTEEEAEQAR